MGNTTRREIRHELDNATRTLMNEDDIVKEEIELKDVNTYITPDYIEKIVDILHVSSKYTLIEHYYDVWYKLYKCVLNKFLMYIKEYETTIENNNEYFDGTDMRLFYNDDGIEAQKVLMKKLNSGIEEALADYLGNL